MQQIKKRNLKSRKHDKIKEFIQRYCFISLREIGWQRPLNRYRFIKIHLRTLAHPMRASTDIVVHLYEYENARAPASCDS